MLRFNENITMYIEKKIGLIIKFNKCVYKHPAFNSKYGRNFLLNGIDIWKSIFYSMTITTQFHI
jgi:hypothetical protein